MYFKHTITLGIYGEAKGPNGVRQGVNRMYEYVGNIHIHSNYSDGAGTIEFIAGAARGAGLDFIIITDHHTLTGKPMEGYHQGVLVLVGMEINKDCNHYLALNVKEPVPNYDHDAQKVIDQVARQGGIGFLAHPVEKGSPLYEHCTIYPWTNWQVNGFTGIEIWNHLSQWRDGLTGVLKAIYLAFINPHRALVGPYPDLMARWDRLLENGLVVAIGGSDAHAIKIKLGPFRITLLDYRLVFRCINTHVITVQPLTGDHQQDAREIYDSLAAGRCFVAYDYFLPARGFGFQANDGLHEVHMGESIGWSSQLELRAQTPFTARVNLIRNGQVYRTSNGCCHSFDNVIPGVYRLEVFHYHRKSLRPWIFSNPIFVTADTGDKSLH